jgi:AraC-like DNA-binding protein
MRPTATHLSKRGQAHARGHGEDAAVTLTQDRLRALIDVLVESVDDPAQGEALAQRAHFSRFHFDRLVRAATGESPAAFRRRLLLERAAHELAHGESVVGAAVQAGYT